MDQTNRDMLTFLLMLAAGTALCIGVPFCAVRSDEARAEQYRACFAVGGLPDECSRISNPKAWREQHEREDRMRKRLKDLRRK